MAYPSTKSREGNQGIAKRPLVEDVKRQVKRARVEGADAPSASAAAAAATVHHPLFFGSTITPPSPPTSLVWSDEDEKHHVGGGAAPNRHHRRKSSSGLKHRRRSAVVPESDRAARRSCFDYLVSAIDEVWAQYCLCTSSAETAIYDGGDLPSSPVSLCGEDDDEDYESGPGTPASDPQPPVPASTQRGRSQSLAASEQPSSVRLLNLKKRLLNAKYYLTDLVEATDPVSSSEFWHRWDMIKYATIELVEEDGDDDDTVDSVCEELEEGRFFGAASRF